MPQHWTENPRIVRILMFHILIFSLFSGCGSLNTNPSQTSDSQVSDSPTITSISPNIGQEGQQNLSVSITGQNTHFAQGTTSANFGAGITVLSLTISSSTSATVVMDIASGAAIGLNDLTLETGTEAAMLAEGFRVASPDLFAYAYTGKPFTEYSGTGNNGFGDQINAPFRFAAPLPPNSSIQLPVGPTAPPQPPPVWSLLSWEVDGDGGDVSSAMPPCDVVTNCTGVFISSTVALSTDANGAITAWTIRVAYYQNGLPVVSLNTVDQTGLNEDQATVCGNVQGQTCLAFSAAANSNMPGTWAPPVCGNIEGQTC
jgi:hypothetical protein